MKKSTIVVLIGGFVLLTAFLGPLRAEKMYKKAENFKTPEEVIEMLDGKLLMQLKNGERYTLEQTKDFAECLSVRQRITKPEINRSKIDVREVIDLDEKTENDILSYYSILRERFSKRLPITKQKVLRLKVDSYRLNDYETGEMERVGEDGLYSILDIVLIDEGEGYVIDFVNQYPDDKSIIDYSRVDRYGYLYDPQSGEKSYSIDEYNSMSKDGVIEEEVEDNA